MSDNAKSSDMVPVVTLPPGHTTASYITQAIPKLKSLAVAYKNCTDGNPQLKPEVQGYLKFIQTFFPWLGTDAVMTPAIRNQSHIDKALEILFDPKYKCPEDIATHARQIYDKFENEQWGAEYDDTADTGSEPDSTAPVSSRPSGRPRGPAAAIHTDDMYQLARAPPPNHPIWGVKGIMHGFIIQPSQFRRFNYVLDPRYEGEKRSFKVFGHNGLTPGDWWPYQKVALFHGAHGHSMAGISGHPQQGAWSVVVSGNSKYEDQDRDLGETIWYSSDHSRDNVDPLRIVFRSNMTQSLRRSMSNRNPVRVLRSSGKGRFAPSCGIRYDGLYLVVSVAERKNAKGGLYEQFKLRRQPDQRPLEEICQSFPTPRQISDFELVHEGY